MLKKLGLVALLGLSSVSYANNFDKKVTYILDYDDPDTKGVDLENIAKIEWEIGIKSEFVVKFNNKANLENQLKERYLLRKVLKAMSPHARYISVHDSNINLREYKTLEINVKDRLLYRMQMEVNNKGKRIISCHRKGKKVSCGSRKAPAKDEGDLFVTLADLGGESEREVERKVYHDGKSGIIQLTNPVFIGGLVCYEIDNFSSVSEVPFSKMKVYYNSEGNIEKMEAKFPFVGNLIARRTITLD